MQTALKALAYTIGGLFVIAFLSMGSLLIAYAALSMGDLAMIK